MAIYEMYAIEAPHALRGSSGGFSNLSTDVSADVEVRNIETETLHCFTALSDNSLLFGFSIVSSQVENDASVMETNTCGSTCKSNSDCGNGGFLQCRTCDLQYEGTQTYETCVEPTSAPVPPVPVGEDCGGQRMRTCHRGSVPMCW